MAAVCFLSVDIEVFGMCLGATCLCWSHHPAEQAEVFCLILPATLEKKVLANIWSHRIIQSGRNLGRSTFPFFSRITPCCSGFSLVLKISKSIDYSMSWQPVFLLECTSCENISPCMPFELLLFQVTFTILCSSTVYYCETSSSVFLMTLS